MGIRVHKAIGWATKKPLPALDDNAMERLYGVSFKEFLEWLKKHKAEVDAAVPKIKDPRYGNPSPLSNVSFYLSCATRRNATESIGRCVIRENEFGVKDVSLFVDPIEFSSWFRYDNTLDWIEETQSHGQKERFRWVTRGLYPYARGQISPGVVGLCILAGVAEIIPSLKEALYVYWS
jgi:hypothetical protein